MDANQMSLDELRRHLEARDDGRLNDGLWCIICPKCRKYFDIWPDRDNISCAECGVRIVAERVRHPISFL